MSLLHKSRCAVLVLLVLFASLKALPQAASYRLKGTVSESGTQAVLVGVNVYIKGTTTGAVTDRDGRYSLPLPLGTHTLVFSYVGYKQQEHTVTLKGNKTLNVTLEENKAILEEVSITSQRKFFGNMDYGREIPTIKSAEIAKVNSSNASDILHARLAGVWATKTSGAPGDQQKIRIRGQASFFSSSEPLYVIDGVPVPIVNLASLGIGDLNMHDIESVTVLKDASASSLYGYQGANGVVLIDTKQRSDNKLNFTYRQGVQWFDNFYPLMNTKEFYESMDLAKKNINWGVKNYYPPYSDSLSDHDRQKEIFQLGDAKEYQLSGGGKVKSSTYYLSGNYTKHDGIVVGTGQEKYGLAARIGTNIGEKLALSFSYRWGYQKNSNNINVYKGNSLIFQGLAKAPCLEDVPEELLAMNGKFNNRTMVVYPLLNDTTTAPTIRKDNQHAMDYSTNAFSVMGRYQFNKHLSVNIIESLMKRHSEFSNNSKVYRLHEITKQVMTDDVNYRSKENVALANHHVNLAYNQRFGAHEVGLSVAHRFYMDNLNWMTDTTSYQIPDHFYMKNSMAAYGRSGSVIRRLNSYMVHANYSYANRYFVSAIGHLGKIRQGFYINSLTLFPSLSLSWDVAKEPFMANQSFINELQLYGNYGLSGNFPLIGVANDIQEYHYHFDMRTSPDGQYLKQLTNHYLKQERNRELDLGFKAGLFKQRLKLGGAFYTKTIDQQIVVRNIPLYYAGGQYYLNFGDVAVQGYELNLEGQLIDRKNTNWTIRGNFSQTSQKVLKLADGEDLEFLSDDALFPSFFIKEGQPLGNINAYEYLGKWTTEDKKAKDINVINYNGFKYTNADTTNKILDQKDLKVVGNSIPDFTWNFSSSFQYRNFGLDVVVYSSWGMQKYNATRAGLFLSGLSKEVLPFYADSTQGIRSAPFYSSSYFVEDAGFIRLKTVALSYRVPKLVKGVQCTLTLNLENFVTLTNYKGYDPEATIYTDNNFSDNAIDRGAYPNPKSVSAGINIKF